MKIYESLSAILMALILVVLITSCDVERSDIAIVKSIAPGDNERYVLRVEFKNLNFQPFARTYYKNRFDIPNNNFNILDTIVLDSKGDYYLGRCIKIEQASASKFKTSEVVKVHYKNDAGTWTFWFIPIEKGKFKIGCDVFLRKKNNSDTNYKSNNKPHNFVE